ncbi:transcriptional repressor TupA/RocA, putative [Aspergillus udagawae]|uniref:Transcriptional repressor TupA/RocA, putative n=1 Tax=Aspergillus udagawae TaxID=91492 RepID=A0A8H3SEK2_9EURO|nr:transcriptional repressor TupA/RocA, putative [Aspergillus udagawae]
MEVLVVLDWFATVPSIIRHERVYIPGSKWLHVDLIDEPVCLLAVRQGSRVNGKTTSFCSVIGNVCYGYHCLVHGQGPCEMDMMLRHQNQTETSISARTSHMIPGWTIGSHISPAAG